MPDFNRGIKAGAVSGLIFGIISPFFTLLASYNSSTYDLSYSYIVPTFVTGIIFYPILGSFFGLIFAGLYEKLMGDISTVKGVVLSTFFWVIISLFPTLLISSFTRSYGMLNIQIIVTLIGFTLYGFVFGMVYDRFKPTPIPEPMEIRRCTNCGRVIPNDSRICPYCGKKF